MSRFILALSALLFMTAGCADAPPETAHDVDGAEDVEATPLAVIQPVAADATPDGPLVHRWNVTITNHTGGAHVDFLFPPYETDLEGRLGLAREAGSFVMEMRCIDVDRSQAAPRMTYSYGASSGNLHHVGGGALPGECGATLRSDDKFADGFTWESASIGAYYSWPVVNASAELEFAVTIFEGTTPHGYTAFE